MCVASNPVYLVRCLFLLHSLLLCVACSCAVVDEKRPHHGCGTPELQRFKQTFVHTGVPGMFFFIFYLHKVYFSIINSTFCAVKVRRGSGSARIHIDLAPLIRMHIYLAPWIRIHIGLASGSGSTLIRLSGSGPHYFLLLDPDPH